MEPTVIRKHVVFLLMSHQDHDDPITESAKSTRAGMAPYHALTQNNPSFEQVGEVPRVSFYENTTISDYDEDEILPDVLQTLEDQAMEDGVVELLSGMQL